MDYKEKVIALLNSQELSKEQKEKLEEIFPELKESEDERMLREIKRYIKEQGDKPTGLPNGTVPVSDMIAWLEKQDKQQSTVYGRKFRVGDIVKRKSQPMLDARKIISIDKACYWCEDGGCLGFAWEGDYELVEQKSTDKTEPKFKVGDWIVDDKTPNDVFCVIEVLEEIYKVIDIDGDDYHIPHCKADNQFHLWSIKEAKDGDVLHSTGFHNDCIFIFNGLDNWRFDEPNGDRAVATGYCCLSVSADKMEFGIQGPDCVEVNTIKPATKIQRELLFQKMKEAGYEWDDDKKVLSKPPKFCVGQVITDDNGTWYKILNIKCLDDWYYKVYDVAEDNTHFGLCSIIDEKFRKMCFVNEKHGEKMLNADEVIRWLHDRIQVDEPQVEYNEDGQPLVESFLSHAEARCIVADKVIEKFKKDFGL